MDTRQHGDETDRSGGDGHATAAEDAVALEIRRRRLDAGLSQNALAKLAGFQRQYISRAENPAYGLPSENLIAFLDSALGANGALRRSWADARGERQGRRTDLYRTSVPDLDLLGLQQRIDGDAVLTAPPGRFFGGATVAARQYPAAVDGGRAVMTLPTGQEPFLHQRRRALAIGVVGEPSHDGRMFGVDVRQVRRNLSTDGSRLFVPAAYELDDVVVAILWAVANLDEGLLHDDAELRDGEHVLDGYRALPRSTAAPDLVPDLSPVSRMWLGSDFCARHILRHTHDFAGAPVFWSREQRGEEASTWLLFQHKLDYLQHTVEVFGSHGSLLERTFCVPEPTVTASSRPERILLLLAFALMESLGIRVAVTAEPEYTAVPGFVIDQHRRAVTASWIGTDGIWNVDVVRSTPGLRQLSDPVGHARAHGLSAASSPATRLHDLAAYLNIDLGALARRCRDLGEYGLAGLAQPRSRLPSTEGVERACRFLGSVAAQER